MRLSLILCAFGLHRWVYAPRGYTDAAGVTHYFSGYAKTQKCKRCRAPEIAGFIVTDVWGQHGFFRPLNPLD